MPRRDSSRRKTFLLAGPQGVITVPTSADAAAIFTPVIADLRARQYGPSELKVQQLEALSATDALAIGIALRYKTNGDELERVGVTYLLHKTDADWKIAVLVLHDPSSPNQPSTPGT